MFRNSISSRHIVSAIAAVAITFAIHGGWLRGVEREATLVTQQA